MSPPARRGVEGHESGPGSGTDAASSVERDLDPVHEAALRALNYVVALVGLLVTSPLMGAIAIAIKLDSGGPVLYRQLRVGKDRRQQKGPAIVDGDRPSRRTGDLGGRPFFLYKFRTMQQDAEADTGPIWSAPGDDRTTRVGRFLRRHRLDELPQLWNVLKGDMALVGPRPERPPIFQRLREQIGGYTKRQTVRPGVTGWAQINRTSDRAVDDVEQKLRYDLEYVARRSLWFDASVMLKTPLVMARPDRLEGAPDDDPRQGPVAGRSAGGALTRRPGRGVDARSDPPAESESGPERPPETSSPAPRDAMNALFEDPARMLWRKAPASLGKANGRPDLSLEGRQNGHGGADEPFGRIAAGAFEATLQGGITDANGTLAELLGHGSPRELIGHSLAELIADPATLDRVLGHARDGRELAGEEVPLRTKQGNEVVVLLCTKLVGSEGEDDCRVVGALIDITERKRLESDLERLAFQDPLTGVANRRALVDHATRYLSLAERRGTHVGLVYLDLSRFKAINDRYGHAAGDAVLTEVARRLEAGAREGDVVSRVGGDEFVVLLPDVDDRDAVVTAARRMKRTLEEAPIELADGKGAVAVRAEAGIAVHPEQGGSLEDLVRAADHAMYRARKRNGHPGPREEAGGRARRPVAASGDRDRPSSKRARH